MKRPNKSGAISRRKSALARLEKQLKDGTKPSKENPKEKIPLTSADIKRINSELQILKNRIIS